MRANGHILADPLLGALALPMTRSHDQGISTRAGETPRLEGCTREKKRLSAPLAAAEEPVAPRRRKRASDGGGMAVKLYLRTIGKVRRLAPQAELKLAARIKQGDQKARAQMIKANLPLVAKIARGFEGISLPLLDLISEGNLGLIKAVACLDPAPGSTLATYCSWWIKHSIKQALARQSKRAQSEVQ
jgi:DNA-directed RNA polymerase sigma subunit (sigma70/sigma32)